MLYNSTSHTCSIVLAPQLPVKWYVFDQKHCTNSKKYPLNILKVTAFKESFSLCNVMVNCVEIITSMLSRPAKFKLIKQR